MESKSSNERKPFLHSPFQKGRSQALEEPALPTAQVILSIPDLQESNFGVKQTVEAEEPFQEVPVQAVLCQPLLQPPPAMTQVMPANRVRSDQDPLPAQPWVRLNPNPAITQSD